MILKYSAGKVSKLGSVPVGSHRWISWNKAGDSALLVGDKGTLLRFDGKRFERIDCPVRENLRGSDYHPSKSLALVVGNNGTLLGVESRKTRRLDLDTDANLRRVRWSPDGEVALVVGNTGTAIAWDGTSGTELGGAVGNLRSVSWHPSGDYALVTANYFGSSMVPSPTVYRYKKGSLELTPLETTEKTDLICVDWRPDGEYALAVGYEVVWQESRVYRWRNKLQLLSLRDSNLFPTAVAWNPNGRFALIGTGSPNPRGEGQGVILEHDGIKFQRVYSGEYRTCCIAWQPEGEYALILGGRSLRTFST